MNTPSFELPEAPPPRPAFPLGWVLLGLMFGLLILGQTSAYFSRGEKGSTSFQDEEQVLRAAVYSNEWISRTDVATTEEGESPGAKAAREEKEKNRKEFLQSLDGAAAELMPHVKTEPKAALMFAVIRHEQGVAVSEESLSALRASDDPALKAAGELYASPPPEAARAKELAEKLKDTSFTWTLAKIHALELAGDKDVRRELIKPERLALFGGMMLLELVLLAAGGVLMVSYAIQRRHGKWAPLGHPLAPLNPVQADQMALRVAQFLLLFVFAGALVNLGLRGTLNSGGQSVVAGLLLVGFAISYLSRKSTDGETLRSRLGFTARGVEKMAVWAACALAVEQPLLHISAQFSSFLFRSLPSPEHPLINEFQGGMDVWTRVATIVSAVVLAPIFEEIVFRGMLLPALDSALGKPFWAIVVNGLLFGAMHPTGIPAILPLATVGFVCAMLTYQTRSLLPAILLHVLHNGLTLLRVTAYT